MFGKKVQFWKLVWQSDILRAGCFIVVLLMVFGQCASLAQAATYNFAQSNWNGGADTSSTAIHPDNTSDWTKYYSKDDNLSAGANLTLSATNATTTDDGTLTATGSATGGGFGNGTNSSTQVSGSGSGASVILGGGSLTWATSTLESTNVVGLYTSLALGSDGYGRISYYHQTNGDLKFIQCTNTSCSTKNTTTVDSTGNVGQYTSLALGSDGFARISYFDVTNGALKFVQCTNASCSTKNTASVDAVAGPIVGPYTSLALGSDGYGRISYTYYDTELGEGYLKFAQCTNAGCTTNNLANLDSGGISTFGSYNSLTLGSDGYGRISYYDAINNDLKFVQCTNASCSTKNTTTVDSSGDVGQYTSLALGSDGFARISYYDQTNGDLKFIQCTNASCSTKNTTTVDSSGDVGQYTSLALGSDGYGRISYYDVTNTSLKFVQCTNDDCSTKTATALDIDSTVGLYTSLKLAGNDAAYISYYDSTNTNLKNAYQYQAYSSSGTFTSAVVDISYGPPSWGSLSWSSSGTGTITMRARSGNQADLSDAAAWSDSCAISNGAALSTDSCVSAGHRYIQYQAALSTSDTTVTPSLDNVTITYNAYSSSQALISSAYNTSDSNNSVIGLTWTEDNTLPAGTGVNLYLRTGTSTTTLDAASWSSAVTNATSGCSKTSGVVTCASSAIPAALRDNSEDQWFQYKVELTSGGANTPTVTNVGVTYFVNVAPQFDATFGTTGISASQISDSGDSNFGKVSIQYKIRDTDTNTGSSTPYAITPSFEYSTNGGSSWTSITSGYLAAGDLTNKTVATSTYNTYSATWDAKSQISGTYATSTKIRVTANDNEVSNSTANAAGAAFTLDAKNPTSSATVDVSAGTVTYSVSDDSNIQYLLSNNSNGSPDGSNSLSNSWTNPSATSTTAAAAWNFASSTYPSLILAYKDSLNNSATSTVVAPSTPASVNIQDVSNAQTGVYKEFLSWGVYTATSSASFLRYEIYRSSSSSYSLLASTTDVSLNYYVDTSVATTTTYSYKLAIVDSDGDRSASSTAVSDLPDGQGGTDVTVPSITSVSAAEVQSTWAKITWTTDEVSDSQVEYSTTAGVYSSSKTSGSMVTSHSVTLTGLAQNTTYYFRVKSTDVLSNIGTNDNSGSSFSFTTTGAPIISDVTAVPADTSATVIWNTNVSSDSYVYYSTSSSLAGASSAGSATLVATTTGSSLFQHKVNLTGLSQSTTYYYYVQSTDGSGNIANDKNANNYYTFSTSRDEKPPAISSVSSPVITSNSAVVVWITDELATSQVFYSATSGAYTASSSLDSTLTIAHVATLSGLDVSTKYYYVVNSRDEAGNRATSTESSFTSAAARDTIYMNSGGGGATLKEEKDTSAPKISDLQVTDVKAFSANVDFSTDEKAIGVVSYGSSTNYSLYASGKLEYKKVHSIALEGLRMGTTYHLSVSAADEAGNTSSSKDLSFTTKYLSDEVNSINVDDLDKYQQELDKAIESVLPSLVPPFVGGVKVVDVTEDSATIKWQTNLDSYSVVAYTQEESYLPESAKPYLWEVSDSTSRVKEHSLTLGNLASNTRYHFRAKSFTLPQVAGYSADMTFVTKAGKIQPRVADVKTSSFRVVWTTDDPTDAVVEYKNLDTGEINRKVDEQRSNFHDIIVDGLSPATPFSVKVTGSNSKGNLLEAKATLKVVTDKDVAPPLVSGVKIENTLMPDKSDKVQTLLRWTTDEPATSVVFYEEGSGSPGDTKPLAHQAGATDVYITEHIVILSSLKSGAIYRIQIESADQAGNTVTSPVKTIVVPRQSQSVSDIIFKNFEDSFKFLRKPR